MCGRFVVASDRDQVFSETGIAPRGDWMPHYNVAPSQRILVLRLNQEGARELAEPIWGFASGTPSPAGAVAAKIRPINARAENIDRGLWRESFHHRRCVGIASGFFEWMPAIGGKKQPIYFRFAQPLGLAAIWNLPNDAAAFDTCAVITVAANDVIARVHDRMPALLNPEAQKLWLDPKTELSLVRKLLRPSDPRWLEPVRVSTEVNSTKNDYPSLLSPLAV